MKIHQNSASASVLLGGKGAVIISDTATHTGLFYSIKAISECVFDTVVCEDSIEGSVNGLTLLAGDTLLLFRITSIKLTSGNAVAYNA